MLDALDICWWSAFYGFFQYLVRGCVLVSYGFIWLGCLDAVLSGLHKLCWVDLKCWSVFCFCDCWKYGLFGYFDIGLMRLSMESELGCCSIQSCVCGVCLAVFDAKKYHVFKWSAALKCEWVLVLCRRTNLSAWLFGESVDLCATISDGMLCLMVHCSVGYCCCVVSLKALFWSTGF